MPISYFYSLLKIVSKYFDLSVYAFLQKMWC